MKKILLISIPCLFFACGTAPQNTWINPEAHWTKSDTLHINIIDPVEVLNTSDLNRDLGTGSKPGRVFDTFMEAMLDSIVPAISTFKAVDVQFNASNSQSQDILIGKQTQNFYITDSTNTISGIRLTLSGITTDQVENATQGTAPIYVAGAHGGSWTPGTGGGTSKSLQIKCNFALQTANSTLASAGQIRANSYYMFKMDHSDWVKASSDLIKQALKPSPYLKPFQ